MGTRNQSRVVSRLPGFVLSRARQCSGQHTQLTRKPQLRSEQSGDEWTAYYTCALVHPAVKGHRVSIRGIERQSGALGVGQGLCSALQGVGFTALKCELVKGKNTRPWNPEHTKSNTSSVRYDNGSTSRWIHTSSSHSTHPYPSFHSSSFSPPFYSPQHAPSLLLKNWPYYIYNFVSLSITKKGENSRH